jgi:hypothetical protein
MPYGDGDQDRPESDREGEVAPTSRCGPLPLAGVTKLAVGPECSEDPDGHVDPEHRPPVHRCQQTPATRPDEHGRQSGDLVDAQRNAALIGGNASVRIAVELAVSIDPPMAWINRQPISHSAPRTPLEWID